MLQWQNHTVPKIPPLPQQACVLSADTTPFVTHLQKNVVALICVEAYRTTKKVKTLICIWNLLRGERARRTSMTKI
jgi:hypothetical protein